MFDIDDEELATFKMFFWLIKLKPTFKYFFLNQASTWFLESAFVREVGMRVSVSVSTPKTILKTVHMKRSMNNHPVAFQFLYRILAIDIIDGQGLSNEAYCELLPKKAR